MTHPFDLQRCRDFLVRLAPEYDDVLLHLLECPECRELARTSLKPRERQDEAGPTAGPLATLVGFRLQRGAETLQKLVRLLSAPPERRVALARSEDFRDLGLAELLLERAAAAQPLDLLVSEELARLAFTIAEPIVKDRWMGRANDVKARACVLVGNARRLEGDGEEADEMFRKAVFHLTGPPDCRERAFYCRNLALLREEQGQLDEAVGLLWRAALIYRENAEPREEGYCLAQLGFFFLEEEQVERAVPPLTRACQVLQPPADAALYARCALALAYCHASLGETEKSRRFLESARPLGSRLPAGEPAAQAAWFQGKVTALTGDAEEAAWLLDAARRAFLAAGKVHAAARVSIDLGRVWAESGREERLEELTADLRSALAPDLDAIGILFVFALFADAVRRRTDLREAVAGALSRLRCCRRSPVLALGYWPAELNDTTTWDGSSFNPSLEPTTTNIWVHQVADRLSGATEGPDFPKGDAAWK